MASRISIALVALALAVVGCRDLVVPEAPAVIAAPISLRVVGLGSDSEPNGRAVTIDNTAYESGPAAGMWESVTESGLAKFPGAPAGVYDVRVDYGSGTPAWSESAIVLGDGLATIRYEGLEFEIRLDWPQLAEFGPTEKIVRVEVSFPLLPRDGDGSWVPIGRQRFTVDAKGAATGVVPWAGRFQLGVIIDGPNFDLWHEIPDSASIGEGDTISIGSPILELPVEVLLGGEAPGLPRIQVEQFDYYARSNPVLRYALDPSANPGTIYLMPARISSLVLQWVDGPFFLPLARYLADGPPSPGPIELGAHALAISVSDTGGHPVPGARVTVSDGSDFEDSTLTDDQGMLTVHLNDGAYYVKVSAEGFVTRAFVVEVPDDPGLEVVLEASP